MLSRPALSFPARLLRARMRAFADDTQGSVTVEAAIMLPLLVWAYCALYSFFDAYRQTSMSHKAAYVISDMISRETNPIDGPFMDGSFEMLNFLTRSGNERRLRVSVIRYDGDDDKMHIEWSETRGLVSAHGSGAADEMRQKLPIMVDEERLILVETWTDYTAPFRIVGLTDQIIETFVFTRSRFSPQICWESCI
ncbi:hypothetical protein RXV86_21595 [Alisedimentitalea sp. MJ-SS2]|uniref:TadE/TadG family type IV pilus assembly protein n=1 Tax=Aliisedimentitalea sp. MJ-SS2 TaxID=3049795 RepID=UPI00290AACAE|nr:hypothetical protein [Alisedimentitalea sp. MJ-SS2]MDU8929988.1 hypothetical protein [Alisedimentitalea sp. MJ-SS2]